MPATTAAIADPPKKRLLAIQDQRFPKRLSS